MDNNLRCGRAVVVTVILSIGPFHPIPPISPFLTCDCNIKGNGRIGVIGLIGPIDNGKSNHISSQLVVPFLEGMRHA